MEEAIKVLVDSVRGAHIPRIFAEWYGKHDSLNEVDVAVLKQGDSDHEWYWEAWDNTLKNFTHIDQKGRTWRLYHDGDLFLYCDALMSQEQLVEFGFKEAA